MTDDGERSSGSANTARSLAGSLPATFSSLSGDELCKAGLCRSCYDAAYHSEIYFGGLKEQVLERDGYCCRVCPTPTDIVHHRKPGLNELAWLITVCGRSGGAIAV